MKKLLITILALPVLMNAAIAFNFNIDETEAERMREQITAALEPLQGEIIKRECENLQSKFRRYAKLMKAGRISEAIDYAASAEKMCPGFARKYLAANVLMIGILREQGIVLKSGELLKLYDLGKPYCARELTGILGFASKYDDWSSFSETVFTDGCLDDKECRSNAFSSAVSGGAFTTAHSFVTLASNSGRRDIMEEQFKAMFDNLTWDPAASDIKYPHAYEARRTGFLPSMVLSYIEGAKMKVGPRKQFPWKIFDDYAKKLAKSDVSWEAQEFASLARLSILLENNK